MAAALLAVFLLFNPAILHPGTWDYAWKHFLHQREVHHGTYMLDRLYLNAAWYTFWGVPPYFYLLYIWVKTPLPLLVFFAAGMACMVRRIREDRFLFLGLYFFIWLFLLSLPGGKFTRYMITLMPAIVLMEALGIWMLYSAVRTFAAKVNLPRAAGWVLFVSLSSTAGWFIVLDGLFCPYYSFYVARQAGGQAKWGYYFPQDDFYDAGLREAIAHIAGEAPQGESVLAATPAAFQYYSSVFHRPDLRFLTMADRSLRIQPDGMYWICQDYRQYYENSYLMAFAPAELKRLFASRVMGLTSVNVYRFSRDHRYARVPFWERSHWCGILRNIGKVP
jgi:hypothetical protein